MKSDIDISYDCKMKNILDVTKKYNIDSKYVNLYGNYKGKIDIDYLKDNNSSEGKLVLITSINPTPYGEGKTTVAIGLCDALNKLGKKSIVALREPSMGPVFGIKGGACGGGYCQVVPMEDINLHFNGDMHAITSANNLLCAIVDNHIYFGNELRIKKVSVNRCLDVNDRALRNVVIKSKYERDESFSISVATEIMAIICLASSFSDLRNRVSKIIVGFNEDNKPVFVKDLNCVDALLIILKDAINPNVVQTLEGNLALVHGGPFANIAHGCSSVIGTKMALKTAEYVVTEAGFGADLGAEKFLDITCNEASIRDVTVVINVTVRALKHHGGCDSNELDKEDITYLEKGICNLDCHIDNMLLYTNKVMVVINKFYKDYGSEIKYISDYCNKKGVLVSVSDSYSNGSTGGLDFANKVIELSNNKCNIKRLYNDNESIKDKINKVCLSIYHAANVEYSDDAIKSISLLESNGLDKYPVCISKTQYSISDNKNLLGYPTDYTIHVKDVYVNNGSGMIVVLMGDVLRMPGLGKSSSYLNMKISDDRKISGLF